MTLSTPNRLYAVAQYYSRRMRVPFPVHPAEHPLGKAHEAIAIGEAATLYATGEDPDRYRLVPVVFARGGRFKDEEEAAGASIGEFSDPYSAVRDALTYYVQEGCDDAAAHAKEDWRSQKFLFGNPSRPKPSRKP